MKKKLCFVKMFTRIKYITRIVLLPNRLGTKGIRNKKLFIWKSLELYKKRPRLYLWVYWQVDGCRCIQRFKSFSVEKKAIGCTFLYSHCMPHFVITGLAKINHRIILLENQEIVYVIQINTRFVPLTFLMG